MTENRLAQETSPYLRQHKNNPVDWYPWGPEALETAKAANKPILLSVGYAACHWCHVMAHESFESDAIAAEMNRLFVNVKVDREERPDLDTLYQTALALMGQQGGWPLTMFLTPAGEPFWGGTYFPPEPRWGRPGFPQVLAKIAEVYTQEPERVKENREQLRTAMRQLYDAEATGGTLTPAVLERAAEEAMRLVDPSHGGTQGAPKFPQPFLFSLLWRAYQRTGEARYRDAVLLTLSRMSAGGIYDHLGGGYARYTVDDRWLVPHFEKMLYDNGQILDLLLHAWRETGETLYRSRIEETVGWLLREMRTAQGAFAASLDADSQGEEGKFYVWDAQEIDTLLGPDAPLFKAAYDVHPQGNWEGKTILNRLDGADLSAAEEETLAAARRTLFEARERRIRPGRDDKILADWNALVIAPLAEAAILLDRPEWLEAARAAYGFIRDAMTSTRDGRLLLHHSYCGGRRQEAAVLDDYANMAFAALRLYELTGTDTYLADARAWTATADALFRDAATGSYYLSPADADDVFLRARTGTDHAVPNGNAVMAQVLVRLSLLTGEAPYRAAAEGVLNAFAGAVQQQPVAFTSLLNAFDDAINTTQIILVSDADGRGQWLAAALSAPLPARVVTAIEDGAALPDDHPAAAKAAAPEAPVAFVCRGQTCSLPLADPGELRQSLSGKA